MAYTVPTVEPIELIAGDSWAWDRTLGDYPASAWTLKYALTGAHETVIELTATADGETHKIRVAAATTAGYTAGRYNLFGYVTDGTDRYTVFEGPLVVLPNPATAAPALSFAERMLTQLETKIADRLSADISSYTLEQQEVHREEIVTLTRQRNAYADAVRRERGGAFFQDVKVEFASPA